MELRLTARPEVVRDYFRLFVNWRAYTMQSMRPNPETGRHFYFRPTGKGGAPPSLTQETIRKHLEGEATIALYAINPGTQRCRWVASGHLSFLKGYDAFAGVIRSGGKTKRAAKMVILNIDNPDVLDLIECKAKEERKARALIDAGCDASLDGEEYSSIFFQNANNSVRFTDEFMQTVVDDMDWVTRKVTTGEPERTCRARDLMPKIAEAAWHCEDGHISFLREGVPAVDFIDLTPFTSYHRTAGDTLDKCSRESLGAVGRVVTETLVALEQKIGERTRYSNKQW